MGLFLLALLEVGIGAGLLFAKNVRPTLGFLCLHLIGTFTPLVLFPHEAFRGFLVPTLLGQYILKNFALLAAALVVGCRDASQHS